MSALPNVAHRLRVVTQVGRRVRDLMLGACSNSPNARYRRGAKERLQLPGRAQLDRGERPAVQSRAQRVGPGLVALRKDVLADSLA